MTTLSTPRPRRRWFARASVLAVIAAPLVACGGGGGDGDADSAAEVGAPPVAAAGESAAAVSSGLVTPEQASALAADPAVTVIDVRTPEEFAEGHISGATMIDFYAADFADQIAQLDSTQRYLVYCRSGNRSGQATAMMAELGFTQVADLDGGVVAWSAAGLPLDR